MSASNSNAVATNFNVPFTVTQEIAGVKENVLAAGSNGTFSAGNVGGQPVLASAPDGSLQLLATLNDNSNTPFFDQNHSYFDTNGNQILAAQQPAVANATNAVDVIARLNDLLARLRTHGLIAP